jgi:hypothetical protein
MSDEQEKMQFTGPTKMVWPPEKQYPNLAVPDTWDTLEDFANWWMSSGKPLLIPFDAITVRTDDATAMSVFRKGEYQVEFYIIHAGESIPPHSHPGLEVITILGGGSVTAPEGAMGMGIHSGKMSEPLIEPYYHGGKETSYSNGFILYSFERWLNGRKPTSAALQWKGPTAGPIHDALLMQHWGVTGVSGYFDVTQYS